ncbi:hypothetical protein BH23ACT12_BH23ACT12_04960 [soil metagenome]
MSASPTVLVACDDLILLDEVIRHLEDAPHWRLVRSVRSVDELLEQTTDPNCILISEGLASELAENPRSSRLTAGLVLFGRRETNQILRAGLKLGARGFVLWPDERDQLRGLVEKDAPAAITGVSSAKGLHAVWAPKGGAGASVIAAHLAGAFTLVGRSSVLVDLDLDHADQTALLGAEPEVKTVGDLLRVADELSPQVVQSVLWSHPLGFRAVLAPGRAGDSTGVDERSIRRVLSAIRETGEQVLVDLPSGLNPVTVATLPEATSVSLVLTPDLLSLRRARDLMKGLRADGLSADRVSVVLNQAGGPDITSKEVEAVLGLSAVTRVRADFQIYRAANRGELSPLGCKLLGPLAKRLAEAEGLVPGTAAGERAPRAAETPSPARHQGWKPRPAALAPGRVRVRDRIRS